MDDVSDDDPHVSDDTQLPAEVIEHHSPDNQAERGRLATKFLQLVNEIGFEQAVALLLSSTPAPSAPPILDGVEKTPRGQPKISTLALLVKDPAYNDIFNREMQTKYAELSYTAFVNSFLSGRKLRNLNRKEQANLKSFRALIDVVAGTRRSASGKPENVESDMYPILTDALNSITALTPYGHEFWDVSQWRESKDKDFRPDLALYSNTEAASKAISENMTAQQRMEYKARCAWAHMISLVEVKPNDSEAGFTFSPQQTLDKGLLNNTETGQAARSAFGKYAAEVMLRQHRTHLFAFYISGYYVRAFYWDRNGCVLTKPMDLRIQAQARQFQNLVFRVASLSSSQQGFDSTVSKPTDDDLIKLQAYESDNEWLRSYHAHMTMNVSDFPIYKIRCPSIGDPDSDSQSGGKRKTRSATTKSKPLKTLLVGRHVHGYVSPTGRSTKGYVAFDLDAGEMVFFKDQWRANAPGIKTELETYERLHKHKVQHIATVIAGGDVIDAETGKPQTTRTQTFKFNSIGRNRKPVERIHTRLVTKEVGRSLETYADQIELLDSCCMAFIAHMEAWEKARVLHRDISIGNIMIDVRSTIAKPLSFLSDWDLAKWEEDLLNGKGASQPAGISGTWPFMSATALQYPTKPSEVADDLESFIYVVLYMAARFHYHDKSPLDVKQTSPEDKKKAANAKNEKLSRFLYNFFYDDSPTSSGHYTGGESKQERIKLGTPPIKLRKSKLLDQFLCKAYTLLHAHYKRVNWEALRPYAVESRDEDDVPLQEDVTVDRRRNYLATYIEANNLQDAAIPLPSLRVTSTPLSSPLSNGQRIKELDNHKALFSLFVECLQQPNMSQYAGDKYFDQFDDLKHVVPRSTKNPSSGRDSGGEPPAKKARGVGQEVITVPKSATSALVLNGGE